MSIPLTEIGLAIQGSKIGMDLINLASNLRAGKITAQQVDELRSALLDAQGSLSQAHAAKTELTEQIRELKEQIRKFENWERTQNEHHQTLRRNSKGPITRRNY